MLAVPRNDGGLKGVVVLGEALIPFTGVDEGPTLPGKMNAPALLAADERATAVLTIVEPTFGLAPASLNGMGDGFAVVPFALSSSVFEVRAIRGANDGVSGVPGMNSG